MTGVSDAGELSVREKDGPGALPVMRETAVVEGRDDTAAVLAAVRANVICTHGYGIRQETVDMIRAAYERTGIVIFTDPDHAGLKIRERLTALFPDARQAYLTRAQTEKDGDIGIENARPDDILKALKASGCEFAAYSDSGEVVQGSSASAGMIGQPASSRLVTMDDMIYLGLAGASNSSEKRAAAGAKLGIGSANSRAFLKRLRYFGIGVEELASACGTGPVRK